MRILLAEDDPLLGDGLRAGLRQLGFQVDWVRDGEAAERELRAQPYAAAVLDLGLPRLDGWTCWPRARAGVTLPVLVLTARDAVPDRIRGLDPAPTTTWSSRSTCTNWPRGCARWCAAPTASRRSGCSAQGVVLDPAARAGAAATASRWRCRRANSTCCTR
jgi:CheY-like chemotaxis protein